MDVVGRISFPVAGGGEVSAWLTRSRGWVVTDPAAPPHLADYLNTRFSPANYSPAHGVFGARALTDAAADLGGRVVERNLGPKRERGTIY